MNNPRVPYCTSAGSVDDKLVHVPFCPADAGEVEATTDLGCPARAKTSICQNEHRQVGTCPVAEKARLRQLPPYSFSSLSRSSLLFHLCFLTTFALHFLLSSSNNSQQATAWLLPLQYLCTAASVPSYPRSVIYLTSSPMSPARVTSRTTTRQRSVQLVNSRHEH